MNENNKDAVKFILWVGGIGTIIVVVLRVFFVDTVVVSHDGMAPTIVAGDRIAVWRSRGPFGIGDIVVCEHPGQLGRYVIGRVIGLPGMRLEAVRNQLQIAGQRVSLDYEDAIRARNFLTGGLEEMRTGTEELGNTNHDFMLRSGSTFVMHSVTVRIGMYLLGDNRSYVGEDSRAFGEVHAETCRGWAFMRLTPGPPRGDDISHGYLSILH